MPCAVIAVLARAMRARNSSRSNSSFTRRALPQGQGIHQAALVPQRIEAAREFEGRLRSDVALVAFGVVADLPDDVGSPGLVESERLAVARHDAKQELDAWVGRTKLVVDITVLIGNLTGYALNIRVFRFSWRAITFGNAQLFSFEHCEHRPPHDVEPGVVAAPDIGSERFLGDDLREDHVLGCPAAPNQRGRHRTYVLGRGDAAAGEKGVVHLILAVEHDRHDGKMARFEPALHVRLMRGALDDANLLVEQVRHAFQVERLGDYEAWPS